MLALIGGLLWVTLAAALATGIAMGLEKVSPWLAEAWLSLVWIGVVGFCLVAMASACESC
jgi:hypothetical protein